MNENIKTIVSAKRKILVSMYFTAIVFLFSSLNYFEVINKRMDEGLLSNGLTLEGFMILPLSMIILFSIQFSILTSLSKANMNMSVKEDEKRKEVDLTNF